MGTGLDEEEEEELEVVVGGGALGTLVGAACVEDMACFTCTKARMEKMQVDNYYLYMQMYMYMYMLTWNTCLYKKIIMKMKKCLHVQCIHVCKYKQC